jgi:hypothetical protein
MSPGRLRGEAPIAAVWSHLPSSPWGSWTVAHRSCCWIIPMGPGGSGYQKEPGLGDTGLRRQKKLAVWREGQA